MSDLWRVSFDSLRRDFEAGAAKYPKLFYAVSMSARGDELNLQPTPKLEWEQTWSLGSDLTPVAVGAVQFSGSRGTSPWQKWCVFGRDHFGSTLEAVLAKATFDDLARPDWKARLVEQPLWGAWKAFQDSANTAGRCLLNLPTHLVPVYPRKKISDRHREDFTWLWLNQLFRFASQHPGSALHAQRWVWLEDEPRLPRFDPWAILTYATADRRNFSDWRVEAEKLSILFPDDFQAQLTEDIFRSSVFAIDLLFHLADGKGARSKAVVPDPNARTSSKRESQTSSHSGPRLPPKLSVLRDEFLTGAEEYPCLNHAKSGAKSSPRQIPKTDGPLVPHEVWPGSLPMKAEPLVSNILMIGEDEFVGAFYESREDPNDFNSSNDYLQRLHQVVSKWNELAREAADFFGLTNDTRIAVRSGELAELWLATLHRLFSTRPAECPDSTGKVWLVSRLLRPVFRCSADTVEHLWAELSASRTDRKAKVRKPRKATISKHASDDWPPDDGWHFRSGQFAVQRKVLALSGKPWEILRAFANAPGNVLSETELKLQVWKEYDLIGSPSIRGHLSGLRAVLRQLLKQPNSWNPLPVLERGDDRRGWKLNTAMIEKAAKKLRISRAAGARR